MKLGIKVYFLRGGGGRGEGEGWFIITLTGYLFDYEVYKNTRI